MGVFLQAMLLPDNFPAIAGPISESAKLGIQNIFAFCFVWSIGGAVESQCRDAFDAMVRSTFQGVAIFPAGAGTVYDYYCDAQRYSRQQPRLQLSHSLRLTDTVLGMYQQWTLQWVPSADCHMSATLG